MTLPSYRVEFWAPGAGSARHSITSDIINIHCKEILTSSVGSFTIFLPLKKNGDSYYYNDIALNDTVRIWLGYGTPPAAEVGPNIFLGKVEKISSPLNTDLGYIREISGLSLGKVLLQRLKTKKIYSSVAASTIVTELAGNLSLGTGKIESDSTALTLHVESEPFFDLLKRISDYWYDAVTQVKKDFYVDLNADLVWASRDGTSPFRSGSDVESFTVGSNIISYNVIRDLETVKNRIFVYGAKEQKLPTDGDSWTESTTDNWSSPSGGSISLETGYVKVGSKSIKSTQSGVTYVDMKRTFSSLNLELTREYNNLHFYIFATATVAEPTRFSILLATSGGNYFRKYIENINDNKWFEIDEAIGPSAAWLVSGSADWKDITFLQVVYSNGTTSADLNLIMDNLYFGGKNFEATVQDSTSQTNYGVRDLDHYDKDLRSSDQVTARGNTLLYQLKDPITQIEIVVPGNTNVKVGDRLSMTIPAENISSQNFDVVSVEHNFFTKGFTTKALMISGAEIRQPATVNMLHALVQMRRQVKGLMRDIKAIR